MPHCKKYVTKMVLQLANQKSSLLTLSTQHCALRGTLRFAIIKEKDSYLENIEKLQEHLLCQERVVGTEPCCGSSSVSTRLFVPQPGLHYPCRHPELHATKLERTVLVWGTCDLGRLLAELKRFVVHSRELLPSKN